MPLNTPSMPWTIDKIAGILRGPQVDDPCSKLPEFQTDQILTSYANELHDCFPFSCQRSCYRKFRIIAAKNKGKKTTFRERAGFTSRARVLVEVWCELRSSHDGFELTDLKRELWSRRKRPKQISFMQSLDWMLNRRKVWIAEMSKIGKRWDEDEFWWEHLRSAKIRMFLKFHQSVSKF